MALSSVKVTIQLSWNTDPEHIPIDKLVLCGSRTFGIDLGHRPAIPDKICFSREFVNLKDIEFWLEVPRLPEGSED